MRDSTCQRIWQAIRLQLPLFLFLLIATIPTFFLLNEVKVSETDSASTDIVPNTTIGGEPYYVATLDFPRHLYVVTVWFGLLIVSIFGGIGVVFLPYNLFNDWIFRPKPITKNDFNKRQKILLPKLINLRKEGKHLEQDSMQVHLMTGLTGYVRRYEFNKKLRIWETCTILAEKEFKKLQDQADFNKRVDPLIYIGKLILSVFAFAIAISFIIVVFMSFL